MLIELFTLIHCCICTTPHKCMHALQLLDGFLIIWSIITVEALSFILHAPLFTAFLLDNPDPLLLQAFYSHPYLLNPHTLHSHQSTSLFPPHTTSLLHAWPVFVQTACRSRICAQTPLPRAPLRGVWVGAVRDAGSVLSCRSAGSGSE